MIGETQPPSSLFPRANSSAAKQLMKEMIGMLADMTDDLNIDITIEDLEAKSDRMVTEYWANLQDQNVRVD